MSKRKIQTNCLVVDASIAQAAGTWESEHPTAKSCRDFLMTVRSVCHRIAWTEAIKSEWSIHHGVFATAWLASMMSLRKLRAVSEESVEELRAAIEQHSGDEHVVDKLLKDVHLIEAALATDGRVASLDDNARGHYGRLASKADIIRKIIWVNPEILEENVIEWLGKGAPDHRNRRLTAQFKAG